MGDFNNWDPTSAMEFEAVYATDRWSFKLENFPVTAYQSFTFTVNPNDIAERTFGYYMLVSDPQGKLEKDTSKEFDCFIAYQSFTATFKISVI